MANSSKSSPTVSVYHRVQKTQQHESISIDQVLSDTRDGRYQDEVLAVRKEADKIKRREAKAQLLPCYTISGIFGSRSIKGLKQHSGFIAVDIDDEQNPVLERDGVESWKDRLAEDDYAYATYVSASGRGICVLVRIIGKDHDRAFQGLVSYFYDKYGILIDIGCGDVSRTRFVSYDPHLHHNADAKVFDLYPPIDKEEKEKRKFQEPVFVAADFEQVIAELSKVNALDDYATWVPVGFALAAKFGEGGRKYFHSLSASSPKYDSNACDLKYDNLLVSHSEAKGKVSTLGKIYWLAQKHQIQIVSKKTNEGVNRALTLKTAGVDTSKAADKLIAEGQTPETAKAIVEQAYASSMKLPGTSRMDVVETFLTEQGEFRYNIIKNKIELNGRAIDDRDVNEFTRQLQKRDDKISKTSIETVLGSEYAHEYNPLIDFIKKNEKKFPIEDCANTIQKYLECFETTNNEMFKMLFEKWYVSIIASIYGHHSPLMLVLTGKQGTGKTEVFRRLLPPELNDYYGESRLDAGKDDHILMCQKLIICNDECGGKNRAEAKQFKELASKQTFSLRFPFGRTNVDIRRLAVLCGTTNEKQILDDPTGNRRILPVEIKSIDFEKIDNVDRTAMFMAAHALYIGGFDYRLLGDDIEKMREANSEFEIHSLEYELICKYLSVPGEGDEMNTKRMTASEVKLYLDGITGQRLGLNKIGSEMKKMGYQQEHGRVAGKSGVNRNYLVVTI